MMARAIAQRVRRRFLIAEDSVQCRILFKMGFILRQNFYSVDQWKQ
jgi:hypothetical protein